MANDDGYGRRWEYRVFSELNECPERSNDRILHIRSVWFRRRPVDYPLPDEDILAIDLEEAQPNGETMEELLLDLERMQRACDKPSLILAEWLHLVAKQISYGEDGKEVVEEAWQRTRLLKRLGS